jgi:hypothetical protein
MIDVNILCGLFEYDNLGDGLLDYKIARFGEMKGLAELVGSDIKKGLPDLESIQE